MKGYPMVVDLRGKSCVVVGGGKVAERKVKSLLAAGASVSVISPKSTACFEDWAAAGKIALIPRAFQQEDTAGAQLVIAATDDPNTNLLVYHSIDTKQWINIVDRPDLCTFTVPAVIERGAIQIAIGTSGTYPAFAKKLREKIEELIGPEYADHVQFLGEVRARIMATMPSCFSKLPPQPFSA